MTHRLLITGSRDWDDEKAIKHWLNIVFDTQGQDVILVSGACPTGADALCEAFAKRVGWKVERHPANWNKHGRAAGPIRNREMVNLGADECMVFIKNNSRGASGTALLAENANIVTTRIIQNG